MAVFRPEVLRNRHAIDLSLGNQSWSQLGLPLFLAKADAPILGGNRKSLGFRHLNEWRWTGSNRRPPACKVYSHQQQVTENTVKQVYSESNSVHSLRQMHPIRCIRCTTFWVTGRPRCKRGRVAFGTTENTSIIGSSVIFWCRSFSGHRTGFALGSMQVLLGPLHATQHLGLL